MNNSNSNFILDSHKLILALSASGILYPAPNYKSSVNIVEVDFDQDPVVQSSSIPTSKLKPLTGWAESSEPDEYLQHIAESFEKYLPVTNSFCAFSYKDIPLFERLANLRPGLNLDVLFGPNSLSGLFPEELSTLEVANIITEYYQGQPLLFRHYLEHFANPFVILESIRKKASHNELFLYIEVPDCTWFFKNGSPLFAWEQHKVYYTSESLLSSLASSSFAPLSLEILGDSYEPSICSISTFQPFLNTSKSSISPATNKSYQPQSLFFGAFTSYLESWQTFFLTNNYDFILFGISHNSDRFIQVTSSHENFCAFFDDTPSKVGQYLAFSNIPITPYSSNYISSKPICFVMGMHPRHHSAVMKRIHSDYNCQNVLVLDIFTTPISPNAISIV